MAKTLKQGFATYPSVKLKGYTTKGKVTKFGIIKELLFGDYLAPYLKSGKYTYLEEGGKTYIKVRARGVDGYILETEIQENRILEINFVDIGQGDGCHLVTPDDTHYIIDAGPSDNMARFLKWRFNLKNSEKTPPAFNVIISHSDSDHYKGFAKVFSPSEGFKQQFKINKIYHNGMIELSGTSPDTLGTLVEKNDKKYIAGLCDTDADYRKRIKGVDKPGVYVSTLNLSTAKKEALHYGSEPLCDDDGLLMEVLGPVRQKINGEDALPVFDSNKGKTKNGHSVILKLTIGKLKLFLGGDLNTESEYYLLEHFTKVNVAELKKQLKSKTLSDKDREKLQKQINDAIEKARKTFQVDVAKSCHHGSADFTSEFLRALNPLATIISSGDDEPHTHPRPDTLGTIGKHSRGERSLIFSTELARSTKEFIEIAKGERKTVTKERAVTVYGMINLRSDGEKVIIAQKLERQAAGRGWDIHKLEWNKTINEFEYKQYLKYEGV